MTLVCSAAMLVVSVAFGWLWNRVKTWRAAQRILPSERATVLGFAGALCVALALVAARACAAPPVT